MSRTSGLAAEPLKLMVCAVLGHSVLFFDSKGRVLGTRVNLLSGVGLTYPSPTLKLTTAMNLNRGLSDITTVTATSRAEWTRASKVLAGSWVGVC